MATLQIRIDDTLMESADGLFTSLGLDTQTAVRIFLNAAIENGGIPFSVSHRRPSAETLEAIEDARQLRNLYGPYDTAKEAVSAMLGE